MALVPLVEKLRPDLSFPGQIALAPLVTRRAGEPGDMSS